ncbi:hypothetical protein V5E97_33595 [Singulisphaera sp. Ch08]|uniref:Dihydrodipicolinate synthase family protein n=1 Tax=Singulisphaera sp. Ch08 TaxID=3120278 RepID=A0AAU7CDY8_9BACT
MSLDPARLSTVQLVPLTPFSEDGETVRTEVLADFARWLYDAGIRVFLPAAGTGEFQCASGGPRPPSQLAEGPRPLW